MKKIKTIFLIVVFFICHSNYILSWGDATHAYFANQLGAKFGYSDLNEIYGSILPDVFNNMLDANGNYLSEQTHENFLTIYNLANNHIQRHIAYGFVSHNQVNGADYTAHIKAFSFEEGYAIVKGTALVPYLVPTIVNILTDAGLDIPTANAIADGIAPMLGHGLAETAVDLLVKRNLDHYIGFQLYMAALLRPNDAPSLLSNAYAGGLAEFSNISLNEASDIITNAEKEYREYIKKYGMALMLPESVSIKILAEQTVPLVKMYLEAATGNAITVNVTSKQVETSIQTAINIVKPDYKTEVAKTLNYLVKVMKPYFVRVANRSIENLTSGIELTTNTTNEFMLNQNYPNPFNASTTISYTIPISCYVQLKIYNMIGQEVATLVNAEQSSGQHTAIWNAQDFTSGIYIYRLITNGFTDTKRLILLK